MAYKKGEPANRSKSAKKRQYASRTPQARSYKTPGRVKESGVGTYSAIRLAQAALRNATSSIKTSKGRPAKKKTVTGPYGEEVLRTRAVTRGNTQRDRQINKAVRSAKRSGQSARTKGITRPPFKNAKAVKAPVKPSKAKRGPNNPKRKRR